MFRSKFKLDRLQSFTKKPHEHDIRLLIAPSGFKETLGPEQVADCIEDGVRRVLDEKTAFIRKVPLHDGGEGFAIALTSVKGGELRHLEVTGPTGEPVQSSFGLFGEDNKTAVIDMASAAGLRLVPRDCRDPTSTTTYGVGQLVAAALDEGCTKIIIGCGDSGTSDGGAGMLQALGVQLRAKDGSVLPIAQGGGSLSDLDSICLDEIHPRLRSTVLIEAVCNIKNVLCGPRGVARVYGPQKGATPDQVEHLSLALEKLATAAQPICGRKEEIGNLPGSGASGGLGTGLLLLGAQLRARQEAIDDYFGLATLFDEPWDIVITGEGSLDSQSTHGKMTVEIAKRAQARGAKVIALAGSIGEDASEVYQVGISAFMSIVDGPSDLEEAKRNTDKLLRNAAEKAIRMIQAGTTLRRNERPRPSAPATLVSSRKESPRGKLLPGREGDRSLLKFARVATT
ncbi:glycerate kinase [Apiospora marii]|uniref:glycerate kinase n=1 Tax=Apiospora marii TaxID=335849 RepID=UPI00312F4298